MIDPDKAIVCGACDLPVTCPTDPKPDDQVVCVRCGARDTYKDVWEACKKHIVHRLKSARERRASTARSGQGTADDNAQEPMFKWEIRD